MEKRIDTVKKSSTLRERLQKSDQEEFIIDLAQPPSEIELRKRDS